VALESGQPIGDLCDLLGISRERPGVFDAMVDLLDNKGADESARDARLENLRARMVG